MGQVVAELLHSLRGLSELVPRGTGLRLIEEFCRGLVVHGRDAYQNGVVTGAPTPVGDGKGGQRKHTSSVRQFVQLARKRSQFDCGPGRAQMWRPC